MTKSCTSKYHEGSRDLPLTHFNRHPTTSDRLQTTCKRCSDKAQQIWRANHREERRQQSREYYHKNRNDILAKKAKDPIPYILKSARIRAKRRNVEFDLDRNDIHIPDRCPIFGIPLFFTKGKFTDNTPSLDRIDSSRGYTRDNVHVISWRANNLKSNATPEELCRLAEYMSQDKIPRANIPAV